MGATDAVKDDIDTVAREAVNLVHEVLILIINWNAAHLGNGGCTSR